MAFYDGYGPCSNYEMDMFQNLVDEVSSKSIRSVLNDKHNYGHIIDASLELQYAMIQMKVFCASVIYNRKSHDDDAKILKTHSELSSKFHEKHKKWDNLFNQ